MPGVRKHNALIVATGCAGAACLGFALRGFVVADWTGALFFTALAVATQFWRVQLPGGAITVTFGMYFAMVLLYGERAIPFAVAASVAGLLFPKPAQLKAIVFNAANTSLALTATAWVIGLSRASLQTQPALLYALLYGVAPMICFLVNSILVAAALATEWNRSLIKIWSGNLRPLALNYLLLSPLGAIVAKVYGSAGIPGVGVFIIPILMARYSFRLYLEKSKEVEEGMRALRRYAEAVEQSNEKLNRRVQELTALQEAGAALGSSLKLQQTLDQIMEIISRALGFGFGLVAVYAEGSGEIEFESCRWRGDTRAIDRQRSQEIVRGLADGGERVVPLRECVADEADGDEFIYFFPLMDKNRMLGVIAFSATAQVMNDRLPALNVFRNQAAAAIANARLYERAERMAITDGLTGLYNHRYFLELLDREFSSALRRRAPLSLLVLDIDNFKLINDTYGHLAGDQLMREVAHALSAILRRTDVLARFGGDEFVIVLPNTNQAHAVEVAEKVRRRIASRDFRIGAFGKIHTTISVGVAAYPEAAQSRQELVERADRAAYYSKQTGRNRVSVYVPAMDAGESNSLVRGVPTPEAYTAALQGLYVDAIRSLAYLIDAKDPYTYGHSTRVERLASELARAIGLPQDEVLTVQRAALLHDIGKVGVSEQILHKRAPLTPDEWEAIKRHPCIGAQIIRGVSFLEAVIPLVYHHQERFDGNGYPAAVRGEAIPIGARIIAIADAYEAMTSDRPYRAAKSAREALAELKRCAGTQFDPQLVDLFIPLIEAQEQERELDRGEQCGSGADYAG